jgi:hypothetical protein
VSERIDGTAGPGTADAGGSESTGSESAKSQSAKSESARSDAGTADADAGGAATTGSASTEPTDTKTADTKTADTRTAEPKTAEPTGAWEAFAPAPVEVPGRVRRWTGRLGRFASHEWTVVSVLGVLLSVAMTWPSALHPSDTLPEDLGDPPLVAWILSWSGHAVADDPTNLWHTNAFFPNQYSFAFTDTLLGYLPANLIGTGWVAAVIRYNVLFIFAFALAFVGAYALVRQLGASRVGAAVAGVAYAYAPWRYSQSGHLHVMSSGGIVLALAMLVRGHGLSLRDGFRRDRARPGWVLAGWLVAAWQITIGFGIGVVFGYVLAGCVLVGVAAWLLRRWRLPRRVVKYDLIGAVVFLAVSAFMVYPYLRVLSKYPNVRRTLADVEIFSPPRRGFFVAPPESLLWGDLHATVRQTLSFPAEMTLLPGFTLIGLALAGLFVSAWSVRTRILLAAGVAVTVDCALGTRGPLHGWLGYTALFHLPGFNALRTPGRLIAWTTLLLGILAAGALSGFIRRGEEVRGDRVPSRRDAALVLATLIPLALVLAEGINKMPHPIVPGPPAAFSHIRTPMVVVPNDGISDELYLLWSTDGFPTMVNGYSGYNPPTQVALKNAASRFPDPESIEQLRAAGVRSLVVVRSQVDNPALIDAQVEELGITREERGDLVVYTLGP